MTIIFVYECSSASKSDFSYLTRLIGDVYQARSAAFKSIYSGGKAKLLLQDAKVRNIKEGLPGGVQVIMVADYDRDEPLNERIRSHCQRYGYELAWMNLDIEDVFLSHQVREEEKSAKGDAFRKNARIDWPAILPRLQMEDPLKQRHSSNLLLILDRYLSRK